MNTGDMILQYVEQVHLDRNIDKEAVFNGLEQAYLVGLRKTAGDESSVAVHIDRQTGELSAFRDNVPIPKTEINRIGVQTVRQVITQKINEVERDAIYDIYESMVGQMISGTVHRNEGAVTLVTLQDKFEAILPRNEKIPGEIYHQGSHICAVIAEVKKSGTKVKVILSRIRPALVRSLFEQEIPEIADGIIEIKGISREPGHRSKIAVACNDPRIDVVGACVGVRGSRIRNIKDELGGEQIDVVPWTDDMQVFISRALQPANVEEVVLCAMLGRAIVLVQRDQRSLAIGRKGQNVRLATKLAGWDIEIMLRDDLENLLSKALEQFSSIPGVDEALADRLVGEGFLSYDDLSIIEPSDLMEMGGLTEEQVDAIVAVAEERAEDESRLAEEAARNEAARNDGFGKTSPFSGNGPAVE